MEGSHWSAQEVGERGDAIFDRLRPEIEDGNIGKYVVIDVHTADYEVQADYHVALQHARTKHPDGMFYIVRIGYPSAVKIGRALMVAGS